MLIFFYSLGHIRKNHFEHYTVTKYIMENELKKFKKKDDNKNKTESANYYRGTFPFFFFFAFIVS